MKDLRSVWFQNLEEIGDVYEIEMRKRQVVINRPFQVGIAVYQMAKLQILQFYYDCLDRYLDRRDFDAVCVHLRQPLFWLVKRNAERGCSTGNAGGI